MGKTLVTENKKKSLLQQDPLHFCVNKPNIISLDNIFIILFNSFIIITSRNGKFPIFLGQKLDRLKMCYIKCVCLYAQVHVSPQVIK